MPYNFSKETAILFSATSFNKSSLNLASSSAVSKSNCFFTPAKAVSALIASERTPAPATVATPAACKGKVP